MTTKATMTNPLTNFSVMATNSTGLAHYVAGDRSRDDDRHGVDLIDRCQVRRICDELV